MNQVYYFVRGSRILDQLNEMSTTTKLRNNIETSFPSTKKRQHATNEVQVTSLEFIPYIGTKMLHVRSTTTSNGHEYKQAIQFLNTVFGNDPNQTSVQALDGQEFRVQPISLINQNVKVRCNCLDFYYRFAHYNHQDKSIVGRAPLPYQRKTQDRPEVNPDHVPGMCKHLLKVVETLRSMRIVQ